MNFKKTGKRGQRETGSGPATLIIVLILLITLYIVLLPPEDRVELLGEDEDESTSDIVDKNLTLFEESPGRLDARGLDEYEHNIDPFTLYRTTDAAEIKKENPFYIKNGWFDKKAKTISFSIDNLENTNNMLLSFTATKYKGMLTIRFNGAVVFENQIIRTFVDPITIEKDLVREENIIELEVGSVGWAFWTTNEYMIEGFKVIADISDTSRQESRNIFIVTKREKENIDKSNIRFNPDCMPNEVGTLEIFLNNNRIFSGIPDCGTLNRKDVSPGYIDEGVNTVVFKTIKGSYLVDQIKVTSELKDIIYPFYYFEINESVFNEVEEGKLDVELTLEFFDDDEYKKAIIYVNGHKTHLNTYDKDWNKNINNYIMEGTNSIKIEPTDGVLDILRLKAEALEKE